MRLLVLCSAAGGQASMNAAANLKNLLESGLHALSQTNYWSVPAERKAAFLEGVQARWTDAVMSIRTE